MVRGAADIAGEKWGTMITWTSLAPPYLMSGDQMYNAMRQSYEGGAQYVVVFNYQGDQSATSTNSTIVAGNGLLQPPQFAVIKKFWTQVVNNPNETNNVKAQEALVLPANFGGALRNQGDGTWGLWQPDNATKQVWNTLQTALSKYGSKLDVVIDDPSYPVASHYNKIIYWNQTA